MLVLQRSQLFRRSADVNCRKGVTKLITKAESLLDQRDQLLERYLLLLCGLIVHGRGSVGWRKKLLANNGRLVGRTYSANAPLDKQAFGERLFLLHLCDRL